MSPFHISLHRRCGASIVGKVKTGELDQDKTPFRAQNGMRRFRRIENPQEGSMNRARDEYIRIVYSKGMQVYLLKHTMVSYEPQASVLDIQGMDAALSGQSYT